MIVTYHYLLIESNSKKCFKMSMFRYTEGTDISLLHANILINVSNHVENFGKLF